MADLNIVATEGSEVNMQQAALVFPTEKSMIDSIFEELIKVGYEENIIQRNLKNRTQRTSLGNII